MRSNLFAVFHQWLKQSLPVFLPRRRRIPSQSIFIIQGGTQRAGRTKLEPGEGRAGGHSWSYRGLRRPEPLACLLVLWFSRHPPSDACWWLWRARLSLIKGRPLCLDKEHAQSLDGRKQWAPSHRGFSHEVLMGLHVRGLADRLLSDQKEKARSCLGSSAFKCLSLLKASNMDTLPIHLGRLVQRNVQIRSFFWNSSSALKASQVSWGPGEAELG